MHDRIARERRTNFFEWMIEREVMRDRGMRILRMFSQTSAGSRCHIPTQNVTLLFNVNRVFSNRPTKTVADFFPVKHLAGIQGHGQVEVRRFDSCQVHWWIEQSSQSGSDLDAIL